MSYFVGSPPAGQVVRRGAEPETLHVGSSPVGYTRLSGQHEEHKLEALLITVPPGEEQGPPFDKLKAGEE